MDHWNTLFWYNTIQKFLIDFHQGCIFLNQTYSKNFNIVKYYYNLK